MAENPLKTTETPVSSSLAERRQRYAAAMDAVTGGICPTDLIDAVMAVADAELRTQQDRQIEQAATLLNKHADSEIENARLRERLRLLTDEKVASVAGPNIELLCAEIAQLRSRVEDWKTAAGAGMRLTDKLRAERDALAAGVPLVCSDERHKTKVFALQVALARVEAVADDLDARGTRTMDSSMCAVAGLIRRALAGEAA